MYHRDRETGTGPGSPVADLIERVRTVAPSGVHHVVRVAFGAEHHEWSGTAGGRPIDMSKTSHCLTHRTPCSKEWLPRMRQAAR